MHCSPDPQSAKLIQVARDTLYLGVDVRHPQAARCTRHPLCSHQWHSPRNCPNMALARMSPYGGNGSGDESEESPADAEKPAVTGDPKRRSPSPGKESPKRRHSGGSGGAESGAGRGAPNSLEKAHSFAAVSEAGGVLLSFIFFQISGTISRDASRSGVTLRVQTGNKEELVHVMDALQERIREYMTNTKSTPKRIMYIRDGVSDTQVPRVSAFCVCAPACVNRCCKRNGRAWSTPSRRNA